MFICRCVIIFILLKSMNELIEVSMLFLKIDGGGRIVL